MCYGCGYCLCVLLLGMASVMCLDSLGYVHILSLPDLKPIYKRFCVDPTDVA